MKKLFLIITFLAISLLGEEVQITADSFQADEINKISTFEGNVEITKGKDKIEAKKLVILFDKNNKPIKYTAEGNPKFKFFIKDKEYEGKADKIIYTPNDGKYLLIGNVFVVEKTENRKIYGDRLELDKKSGKIKISGGKNKPVKFIFKVQEK
ncbi:MAG: lipopolysaccharide transport periplasmic protein LptA [Epsilonproteobacteria bacterium]|nr:lipopolysaccharide transport periplasmic protein LptA [Campylobacterota bacterium]